MSTPTRVTITVPADEYLSQSSLTCEQVFIRQANDLHLTQAAAFNLARTTHFAETYSNRYGWQKPRSPRPQHTARDQRSGTFPFLKLPRELRDEIYELVLVSPEPVHLDAFTRARTKSDDSRPAARLPLFRLNKVIYGEASWIFFNYNTFSLVSRPMAIQFFERYLTEPVCIPADTPMSFTQRIRRLRLSVTVCMWKRSHESSLDLLSALVPFFRPEVWPEALNQDEAEGERLLNLAASRDGDLSQAVTELQIQDQDQPASEDESMSPYLKAILEFEAAERKKVHMPLHLPQLRELRIEIGICKCVCPHQDGVLTWRLVWDEEDRVAAGPGNGLVMRSLFRTRRWSDDPNGTMADLARLMRLRVKRMMMRNRRESDLEQLLWPLSFLKSSNDEAGSQGGPYNWSSSRRSMRTGRRTAPAEQGYGHEKFANPCSPRSS